MLRLYHYEPCTPPSSRSPSLLCLAAHCTLYHITLRISSSTINYESSGQAYIVICSRRAGRSAGECNVMFRHLCVAYTPLYPITSDVKQFEWSQYPWSPLLVPPNSSSDLTLELMPCSRMMPRRNWFQNPFPTQCTCPQTWIPLQSSARCPSSTQAILGRQCSSCQWKPSASTSETLSLTVGF